MTGAMSGEVGRLARLVLATAGGYVLLLAVITLGNLCLTPQDPAGIFVFTAADGRNLVTGLNRNFNQLLAIVFTTVSIAVPLTANMYSVKMLELFIKDRINLTVLLAFAFAIPNNIWLLHSVKENYWPVFQVYLSLFMVLLYPALLVPYLYYIFQFLHPHTLLQRLVRQVTCETHAALRHPARADRHAGQALELIEHTASIGLRSIDRAERSTAVESVEALRSTLEDYWRHKAGLPAGWHETEGTHFRGFSEEAMLTLSRDRLTVEMKIFTQLRALLSSAVPRMHILVNAIAETTCELGLHPHARNDTACREMIMQYFNTFIRLSLNRKDHRSAFTLFNQYRRYAEEMLHDNPEHSLEIAFYFQYYAQAARDQGMPFVVETIAHDLGALVQEVWARRLPQRGKFLERFLEFETALGSSVPDGVKKAQALLAAFFRLQGEHEAAADLGRTFSRLSRDQLLVMQDDLLHVRKAHYWEINERMRNMDFVPDEQRREVGEFFATLLP